MALINPKKKEVQVKLVYYGPGRGGKTTNLEYIFNKFRKRIKGNLTTVKTYGDRTLFFDFMPMEIGVIKGYNIKMQFYTVPGQVKYSATRRLVLRGVDGIVFVADSMALRQKMNIISLKDLQDNLATFDKSIFKIPLVIQYNKRDLADEGIPILPVETLENDLNKKLKVPSLAASAITGENVVETMKKAISLTVASLEKRLELGGNNLNADKGKLTSELNDRLDDLFSDSDEGLAATPEAPPAVPADTDGDAAAPGDSPPAPQKASPLMELDAIVLSLDWEITDENLEKLLSEIERLKALYKDARLPYMFLQLHGSVGKYIASKKVDAHPDSIKLLHSVHAGLEKVLMNPDMDETEKKKILSEEVKKFKGLKHQIMLTKSEEPEEAESIKKTLAPATPSPEPPAVPATPAITGDINYQAFIEEIRKIIQAEFKELKKEIMSWKEGQ